MPLTSQTPVLARGFDILFDQELAPVTTPDSARAWAQAYTAYAVSAGIPLAKTKEVPLAGALTVAFDPTLGGGGPPLFIQALQVFWLGLPIPYMPGGVVSVVAPSGSVNSPQPDDATPLQQADGLAATIAGFTLGSVKVLVPGPPPALLPIF
jgi:hypothetical protein